MTDCTIITVKNSMILVEYRRDGRLMRSWVTASMIDHQQGKKAIVYEPWRGVPFSRVEWERVLPPLQATTAQLAEEFKKRGIWTVEDLRASSEAIQGALVAVYGVDVSAILTAVKDFERNQAQEIL